MNSLIPIQIQIQHEDIIIQKCFDAWYSKLGPKLIVLRKLKHQEFGQRANPNNCGRGPFVAKSKEIQKKGETVSGTERIWNFFETWNWNNLKNKIETIFSYVFLPRQVLRSHIPLATISCLIIHPQCFSLMSDQLQSGTWFFANASVSLLLFLPVPQCKQ